MKKIILSVSLLLLLAGVQAQNKTANSATYKNAIGVKVWDGGGFRSNISSIGSSRR
ncbi:hypothetical protein [Ferruginibacter sp.]